MSGPEGYRVAGDVELQKVTFVGIDSAPVDITGIVSVVNVYQNIFRHYMECELVFTDASKFLHYLPYFKDDNITGGFTGSEVVIIEYRNRSKDNKEKTYTHSFRMYSLSDRNSLENKEIYLMSGISEEGWRAQTKRISKALGGSSGNTTENIMNSIFKQYFKTPEILEFYKSVRSITHNRVDKQLNTMPTIGIHKFVVPNWTLDTTIDFICDESDCATRIPYFLFYEDSENFNFSNVNGLTSQEPIDTYNYIKTNIHDNKSSDENKPTPNDTLTPNDKIILGYKVTRQQDFLENVQSGLYKASTKSVDMLKKKTNEVVYDYQTYAPKFNKLQNNIISGVIQNDVPVYNLMSSRTNHDNDPLFESENPKPKRTNVNRDIRQGFLSSVFNTSVEISIPANPDIKVGQVLHLSFPVDLPDSDLLEKDKYLTGNYLVTKVRQHFTPTNMETLLECTKDGGL
jgi:hypothetical protein